MTNNITEIPAVQIAPLVKNPELIKVKTISSKIADQLQMIQEFTQEQWDQVEIIGVIPPYLHVLARTRDSHHIIKLNGLCFIIGTEDKLVAQGLDRTLANEQANQMLAALPQVFQI